MKAVAHAVAHPEVLGLCLREQLVTHAAHFKFQSLDTHGSATSLMKKIRLISGS